ncbi:hypothetical protein ACFFU9_04640 [Mariniflexile ostreae]|uniref:NlpE C-terminal OB domain-containing protein n=1 Tax=Mariniflexile ostreae TaxID=1520892 RepID=A0ABV5F9A2_9FLAO
MKKTLFIAFVFMAFIGCKNKDKAVEVAQQKDELTLLKGEFIYYSDAAVLQTNSEIYGVIVDENMHKLEQEVQRYKKEATDMVPVEIRGHIVSKPDHEEGWPFRVEIKEIVKVSEPKRQEAYKVQK